MEIRPMQEEDIDFALYLTGHEKWSDIKSDFLTIISYPKQAAFIMEDDERIGIISAINYGEFGFIGSLIVHPDYRGRGFGTSLLKFGVKKLKQERTGLIMLDAVQEAIPIYEKLDFKIMYKSHRFRGTIHHESHPLVSSMESGDLSNVFEMDRICFGADRSHFVEGLYTHHPEYGRVIRSEDGQLVGYAFASMRREYCRIGPVILTHKSQSEALIRSIPIAASLSVRIGVPGYNEEALNLFKRLGLREESGSYRMGLGNLDVAPQSAWQYAIGSPAKG